MNSRIAHVLGALALALAFVGAPLALGCSPEQPAFRGSNLSVDLAPGESAHFTVVMTRAAVDQAQNGLAFQARPTVYTSSVPLTTMPDDASLDELFTGANGSVSRAELDRVCPGDNECRLGVTLTHADTATESIAVSVRFGVESYDGFDGAALVEAIID